MSRLIMFEHLKAYIKARGLTYRQLADGVGLSEQTIKRVLASNDCSVQRLEAMCQFLQIEVSDLSHAVLPQRHLLEHLSWQQEVELVHNKQLLVMAVCLMNFWTFDDMLTHLRLERHECAALLHRLEAIGLIQVRAAYRYKLLVARHFSWIVDGPIMRWVRTLADDFFDCRFEGPGEVLKIVNVRLSVQAQQQLKTRLEKIAQEYADRVATDSHLPLEDRPPLSICIAVRSWVPHFMRDVLKEVAHTKGKPPRSLKAPGAASPPGAPGRSLHKSR